MEILLFVLCFLVFLFSMYGLARDDFIFLRKNISMDMVFNMSFLGLLVAAVFSRLFFVLNNFSPTFLNPIMIVVVPYAPGFSSIGGIIGFVAFFLYYASFKKIPTARLFDFISLSLLASLTIGHIGKTLIYIIEKRSLDWFTYAIPVLFSVLTVIFFFILLPKHRRGDMKDGYAGLIFLVSFFGVSLLTDVLSKNNKLVNVVSLEGILSAFILVISLFFLLKREKRKIKFAKVKL